jgi:excisionase family DNA binding protein
MNPHHSNFVTTSSAAQLLGLSTTTIQTLIDKNELQGWKTQGGHRRISLASIQHYIGHTRLLPEPRMRGKAKITVALETAQALAHLQHHSPRWQSVFELRVVDSITQALIDLGGQQPDLLVAELTLPLVQQQKALQVLMDFNAREIPIAMVLITHEPALLQNTPFLSPGIQLLAGPLPDGWMDGFFTGLAASLDI